MTPHLMAEKRVALADEYASLTDELANILAHKAIEWSAYRVNSKTDKEADRKWEASDEGIREMRIKLHLKALEKQISSIKTMLDVLTNEARNLI